MSGLDVFSALVDGFTCDLQGFCLSYPLRRHLYAHEANEGSRQARSDWLQHVGVVSKFGSCNPYSGHFAALVLPLCIPSRLRLISYIFKYAFIYDQHLESATSATFSEGNVNVGLDEVELPEIRSKMGTKRIQAKMQEALLAEDEICAKVVLKAWKEMVVTTAQLNKEKAFENMEQYVEYRIVDTGAPYVHVP